jgi:hypothetical protein
MVNIAITTPCLIPYNLIYIIIWDKFMLKINRFDQRLKNITNDLWVKIAKIDELKGKWSGGLQAGPYFLTRRKRTAL